MASATFLGTGGAFTDFRVNYHNNLMVEVFPDAEDDKYLLIDCGGTAVQSAKELLVEPWQILGVLVTHLHGDHINGIEQLLWERFYRGPAKPGWRKTVLAATRTILDQLRVILTPCVDEITVMSGKVVRGGYDLLVQEVEVHPWEPFSYGETQFCLLKSHHVLSMDGSVDKECYGVRITTPRGSVYYTSDTVFDPNIGIRFPKELIFHDCTFTLKYPGTVHTHYEELLTLPDQVRSRIVLMHYGIVPKGVNVVADGFRNAARRHENFPL